MTSKKSGRWRVFCDKWRETAPKHTKTISEGHVQLSNERQICFCFFFCMFQAGGSFWPNSKVDAITFLIIPSRSTTRITPRLDWVVISSLFYPLIGQAKKGAVNDHQVLNLRSLAWCSKISPSPKWPSRGGMRMIRMRDAVTIFRESLHITYETWLLSHEFPYTMSVAYIPS